jgi:POT family proton-dependent oligopeptide transporter
LTSTRCRGGIALSPGRLGRYNHPVSLDLESPGRPAAGMRTPHMNLGTGFKQRTFLGHPVGLYILFLTEMWERFNYYGMRALLMLYMVNYFRWSQENASTVYKWYTSLVYLTPLLGGYLADRVLGNKWAVVIGAIVMAIGEFLLAFDPVTIFFAGLVFMIVGNGFFKPNMSTQVGRLYPQGDPRRDGAYTIFYMGINLGAFLAPLVCGGLIHNYHMGFTAAGVGMILGLLTYLLGLPWIHELPQGQSAEPKEQAAGTMRPPLADEEGIPEGAEDPRRAAEPPARPVRPVLSEEEAARTVSVAPWLTGPLPVLLAVAGVLLALAGPALWLLQLVAWDNMLSTEVAGGAILFAAWITAQVRWALRDRLLSILLMGIPVVAFWAAGEQAGNALNIWADKTTNRYLTMQAPTPPLYTGTEESAVLNPVATTAFQSINPLAIFVLAPPFALLWTWLARRGWNPSIPTKMAFGVLCASGAMGIMAWSAAYEKGETIVSYAGPVPDGVFLNDQNQLCSTEKDGKLVLYHQGRLTYDRATHEFHLHGVLSDLERDDIVGATAPPGYVEALKDLKKQSNEKEGDGTEKLAQVPPGFKLDYSGLNKPDATGHQKVTFDAQQDLLEVHKYKLAEKDLKALRVAGGDEAFRKAMDDLYLASSRFRVSSWWLFWSYVLVTVGELCLSPIGLSMVSKLAPARFATMLMGLWMLTSFFGNFIAGALGEQAGTTPPLTYFLQITLVLGVLSLAVFVLASLLTRLMHGVD